MTKGRFTIIMLLLWVAVNTAGCGKSESAGLVVSGTIEAREIAVSGEIGGKIVSVNIAEGDFIKKGQEIAKIDDTILAWQVKQAEAAAGVQEANLNETKQGSRVEQISQAEATAAQIQALADGARKAVSSAQKDLLRIKDLLDQGAVTQQQYESADLKLEAAESQLTAYASQYQAASEQVKLLKAGATRETISAAESGFAQALAGWEIAKAQLAKTVVQAPIDGVIKEKVAEPGEIINQGGVVAVLMDLEDLWVEVYIPEAELGKVKLGQEAAVQVDAFPGKQFQGEIIYIANEAEFTPKNVQTKEERTNMVFLVKVALPDQEGDLKPGMPADVVIGG